ncbi:oligogalacturonate lyase family protein [Oleiharenicola lentus]|uniref:oligogalacturonate lyase family protein n=1 Tax=Oleiharenicola lentus TaxID=2508720 RepID=UPI003F66D6E2
MKKPHFVFGCAALVACSLFAHTAIASNVGKRYASEKKTYTDAVTGFEVTVLTKDDAGMSKPYQTHTTWTADGKWIIGRGNRGGNGSQSFLINENTGDIIQVTDGPLSGTGSQNLARKSMKLYVIRGGRAQGAAADAPATPRQLVEINLDPLITDAMSGKPKDASAYERIVCTLPEELRDAGGFALDADETKAYWGVTWGTPPPRPAATAPATASNPNERRSIDNANTNPAEAREAARQRFATNGKGPGGIRAIDLATGVVTKVIDTEFRMGHVQTNPWVPGEIIYCHETTGDAPQRMWTVRGDGTGNRPLYVETPDEWITHETVATKDEVMFNIMGHLPYLRERPTGVAVINLRTNTMKLLGQVEEDMGKGQLGGFWHCNGSPDGKWAVADTFKGDVFIINRETGEKHLLTTDHKMKPDHTHPIFSPDSKRVLIQSGKQSDGKTLDLMYVELPAKWSR